MSETWVMVRLTQRTRAALRTWAEDWQRAYESGHVKAPPPASPSRRMDDGPSVDQLVAELLRRDEAHRARARKQRLRGERPGRRRRKTVGTTDRPSMEAPDVGTSG